MMVRGLGESGQIRIIAFDGPMVYVKQTSFYGDSVMSDPQPSCGPWR